jgi:hypothetical protein
MGLDTFVYVEQRIEGRWWYAGEMEPNSFFWESFEQARLNALEFEGEEEPPYMPRALCVANFGAFARTLYIHQDAPPLFALRGPPEDLSAELAAHFKRWEEPPELMTWMMLDELLGRRAELEAHRQVLWPLLEVWEVLEGFGEPDAVRLVFMTDH